MSASPIERTTLSTVTLDGAPSFASVEVRRITIAPGFHVGTHWHNGPVFGRTFLVADPDGNLIRVSPVD